MFGGRKGNQTEPAGLWKQIGEPEKLKTFDEAVKSRVNDGSDHPSGKQAHRSASLLHLCNIAIRTGRKIRWDAAKEEIVGDVQASQFLEIPLRAPWHF